MNEDKKKSPKKILVRLVSTTSAAIAVLMAFFLVGVRLLGYTPFAVLSGSMTPMYEVGDLVYVKYKDPEKIYPGSVISYVISGDTIVTHRVADVNRDEKYFTTWGDANKTPDAGRVSYENVIGTVRFSIPKLGYLSAYMATDTGKIVIFSVTGGMLILAFVPDIIKKANESGRKMNKEREM